MREGQQQQQYQEEEDGYQEQQQAGNYVIMFWLPGYLAGVALALYFQGHRQAE
jgi:hypothetical protein